MTANVFSGVYQPSEWGLRFHARRENEVFGGGAAGPGKALCLKTLVPTPHGLRFLGDIHPGDTVFNIHGEQVKVLAESEIFTDRPCYKFRIRQEYIVSDAEHIWCIDGGFLETTEQIHNSVFAKFVPASLPVEMAPAKHLLDPYVLGVCLMRGQPMDRSKFTTWDPELYSTLKDIGYTLTDVSYKVAQIVQRSELINELVRPDKRRIPTSYMLGSFNQRMALVEGIMDGGNGRGPLVDQEDMPFLVDFYSLAASLGLGPTLRKTKHGAKWYVTLQSQKYKCSRFIGTKVGAQRKFKLRDQIRNSRRVPSVPTKCIQVSGGGTFLITKAYIPTHNSMVLLADPLEQIRIEFLRCLQKDFNPDPTWPPEINSLIKQHPLKWGHSDGWALHMRRTFPRLKDTIARAHRMFPQIDPDVQWNEKDSIFKFSSGFRYQFGHCKDRVDYNNYLGQHYTHLAFDELIEFLQEQYQFIGSRLRTGDPVLKHLLKNRSASNPRLGGNKGEDISVDDPGWVKKYFVDPWPEGNKVLRRKLVRKDGSTFYRTKLFMPATLYDNPNKEFIKQYEEELLSKPKHIRDVYLLGKWDGIMGSFLEDTWNPTIHVCKPFKIPNNWPIFRAMDWGYKTAGMIGWYAVHPEGTCYKFFEIAFKDKTATEVAKMVKQFEEKNKLWDPLKGSLTYGPADTQIWEERGNSAVTKYMEFVENGVDWCQADKKSREVNASVLVSRLRDHENFTKTPGLVIFENCVMTRKVLPAMETDLNNLEQPKKGGYDHPYDETTYAMQYAKQELDAPNYKGPTVEHDEDDDLPDMRSNNGFGYY
jgi:hypothetical protein